MSVTGKTMDLLSSGVPLTLLFDLALGAPAPEELLAVEEPWRRPGDEQLAS